MENNNMFEKASRMKLRFPTAKGLLEVEDLWDIPLKSGTVNLNQIAIDLYNTLKKESVSFVEESSSVDVENQLKFDIVKHIIDVRIAEAKEANTAVKKKGERDKILRRIAEKEENELSNKSVDELKKMLEEI